QDHVEVIMPFMNAVRHVQSALAKLQLLAVPIAGGVQVSPVVGAAVGQNVGLPPVPAVPAPAVPAPAVPAPAVPAPAVPAPAAPGLVLLSELPPQAAVTPKPAASSRPTPNLNELINPPEIRSGTPGRKFPYGTIGTRGGRQQAAIQRSRSVALNAMFRASSRAKPRGCVAKYRRASDAAEDNCPNRLSARKRSTSASSANVERGKRA